MKVGEEWVDLGVHFVDTIPKGLDVIVGLDNHLNCVDLERGEGKLGRHILSLFICTRTRRKRTKSRRRLVVRRT
jgi:hypothetical protein